MSEPRKALADARIRAFVDAARVAHLATADADARPHNVPLCFVLIGDALYFVIDEKPKAATGTRLKRMRSSPWRRSISSRSCRLFS